MKENIQMLAVLSLICGVCALALSGFRSATAERIENQVLTYVQGPKVNLVLAGAENDLIADRRKIEINGEELQLFIGKKNGEPWAIAYESTAAGFGGDLSVMVGYLLAEDKLSGIQIISHKETPGIGAKVTEDRFTGTLRGRGLGEDFRIKSDGGDIDAVTGATYSSRGVAEAIQKSIAIYPEVKLIGLAPGDEASNIEKREGE